MSSDSPVALLYDDQGDPIAVAPGTDASKALSVQGVTGGTPVPVTGSVTATVDTSALATSTKQDTGNTSLSSIDSKVPTLSATAGSLHVTQDNVPSSIDVGNFPATQDVHVTNIPHVIVDNTITAVVDESTLATEATLSAAKTDLDAIKTAVQGMLAVDGSAHVQPVSSGQLPATLDTGNLRVAVENTPAVTISGTPNVTVTSSVLPTGASQDATLTGGSAKTIVRGGAKGATTASDVTSTAQGADHQALDVEIYFGGAAKDPQQIRALSAGTDSVTATISGTPSVTVSGTAAVQDVALEASAASIDSKTPSQGQATMSASVPVVIASNQSAIPVTGTITASEASIGTNGSTAPTSSNQAGGTDGTNLQPLRVFDADTGAGTQYVLGVQLRKGASGGSVEAGTASDPIRTDPTGTTVQPISATSLPLPTSASTEATLSTRLADSTFTARINTLGQKTMANSTPVVLSSDQSAIPVTDNSGSLTIDSTQLPAALDGSGNFKIRALASGTDSVTIVPSGTQTVSVSNSFALDATLTGGNQVAQLKSGTKSTSTAALVTSTAASSTRQPLDVTIYDASGNAKDPTQIRALASGTDSVTTVPSGTQTVGGTVTANIGTSGSLALDATLTGGSQVAQIKSGTKGTSSAAVVTSTASGSNHQALDIAMYDGSGNQLGLSGTPVRVDPTGTTTQPISAASLPLPSGASTAAKQPALGTAGSASTDVLTVQGIASMTALKVDPSGVTSPVSGTVTANIGTSGSLALDATLTGGTQKVIVRGGAKGTTTAADVTSSASGSNHQPLDVAIYDGSGNQITSFGGSTADVTASGNITAVSQSVTATLTGHGSGLAQLTGTWSGNIQVQGSVDNSNYVPIPSRIVSATGLQANTIWTSAALGTNSILRFATAGLVSVRVTSTSWSSGTATISIRCTPASATTSLSEGLPQTSNGLNVSTTLGSVGLTDGVSLAVLKAASTAATSSDPGIVTTLSPNSAAGKLWDGTNTVAVKAANTAAVGPDPALVITPRLPPSATVTSVAAAVSAQTILSSNTNRFGAVVVNDSSAVMYLKLGSSATTSSYSYSIPGYGAAPFANWECPAGYTGIITAVWSSATGNARVTEITT